MFLNYENIDRNEPQNVWKALPECVAPWEGMASLVAALFPNSGAQWKNLDTTPLEELRVFNLESHVQDESRKHRK